ncbi:MerR family transcriptional regulator [Sciscionella sediminilitoris]|uniref:MerR family transcriptional regulator n=1 Tax=Sciscionella sediminilitoris TaxID=1445613 RepID=UPI0004DF81EC|nr:MerR family transcriptional regulator [Sciscionella sp. SE31]
MAGNGQAAMFGIRDVAEQTGLSMETLRWYERAGLVPPVHRGSDGRRRYSAAEVGFVRLIVCLRRTGMPVARVREFVDLVRRGASTHGKRMTLLTEQRDRILDQMAQLRADLATVEHKIGHYGELIEAGLDCEGAPVSARTAELQRRG